MSGLMKWPGSRNKADKPDLSKLSDDELDDLIVMAGLMDQDELDQQRDMKLVIALANLPGGPPEYCETLRGLMRLRDEGPFPLEAQDLYDRLRARAVADVEATRKAVPQVTPSPAEVPADMSFPDWLRAKWVGADTVVRNALQAVAERIGVPIPMSRTRIHQVPAKDSSPAQRSESEQHPNHDESEPLELPAEAEPEDRYDGPQWSDDDALDWEPCESLHDALHPDDRGWF